MSPVESNTTWQIIVETVQGASHKRKGILNQDAVRWEPETGQGTEILLAVSDGHGSSKSFLSHIGSKFAVQTAIQVMKEFLEKHRPFSNQEIQEIKRISEERLPKEIERLWKQSIDKEMQKEFQKRINQHKTHPTPSHKKALDFVQNQITKHIEIMWSKRTIFGFIGVKNVFRSEQELSLHQKKPPQVRKRDLFSSTNPYIAFGATLISAIITPYFLLLLQLGDGNILLITQDDEIVSPMPKDERLLALETTSLCSNNAWKDFRIRFQRLVDKPPKMILLATDGLADSYSEPKGFIQFGTDIFGSGILGPE